MRKLTVRSLSLLICASLLLALPWGVPVNGAALSDLSYEIVDGEVTITDCDTNAAGELVIPDTIEGCPVTVIGDWAFAYCDELTSITLPETVKQIDELAFYTCSAMTEINIPAGLTGIADGVFQYCRALDGITLPDSVASIGNGAFYGCESLSALELPAGVTSIGERAFESCDSLTEIALPAGITTIADGAFTFSGLTGIRIPEGVTSIGYSAFSNCYDLTEVTVPSSVNEIGQWAFSSCDSMENVYISDLEAWCTIRFDYEYANPLYYANHLYLNGQKVTTLEIPKVITVLADYAFYGCPDLTQVTAHSGLKEIGDAAFGNCEDLVCVTLPDGITRIGKYAFDACRALETIRLPIGMTVVDDGAFRNCAALTEVTLPDSVERIGREAFWGCTSLNFTEYSNGKYLGTRDNPYYALVEPVDHGMSDCCIQENTELIAGYAFFSCRNIEKLVIPASVKYVGDEAFAYCDELQSVRFEGNAPVFEPGTFATYADQSIGACYEKGTAGWDQLDGSSYGDNVYWLEDHLYGDYIPDGNATCTADGTKTASCILCGQRKTVADPGSAEHCYMDGVCQFCGSHEPVKGYIEAVVQGTETGTIAVYPAGATEPAFLGQINEGCCDIYEIPVGSYTLVVSSEGYVSREYEVTLIEDANLMELSLSRPGDPNGDGVMDISDVARIYAQTRGAISLEAYALACADMDGDGTVDIADTARAYAAVKE